MISVRTLICFGLVIAGCGGSCIKDQGGCAERATLTLSVCAMGGEALSLAGLLENPPADGEVVSVQGPLRSEGGMCTQKACSGIDACCNGCGAGLVLSEQPSPVDLYTRQAPQGVLLRGSVQGVSLTCGGDESLICCPLPTDGTQVIAAGVLRSAGTPRVLSLEVSALCLAP